MKSISAWGLTSDSMPSAAPVAKPEISGDRCSVANRIQTVHQKPKKNMHSGIK